MSAPSDSSGTLKYWLDGEPFNGIQVNNNDPGTAVFWLDGEPDNTLFFLGVTTTQTILSDAQIAGTTTQTILSNANIFGTTTQTILSDANVVNTTTQTILSDAHISGTITQTILSDAKIFGTSTQTILSDADIVNTFSQTILSDAHIAGTVTQTILSDSEVVNTYTQTIFSSALIFQPYEVRCAVKYTKDSQKDVRTEVEVIQPVPSVPTFVTVINTGTGDSLRIEWQGTSLFYNVYRVDSGPTYVKLNNFLIQDKFYIVGGLNEGTTYTFVVRGADGEG